MGRTTTKKPGKGKDLAAGGSSAAAAATPAPVLWKKSTVSEELLQKIAECDELPHKDEIQWRAAGEEIRPKPNPGEIVVLLDHATRGLRLRSLFFRQVMSYFGLTPLDVAPNSMLNISNIIVFCEDYLQIALV